MYECLKKCINNYINFVQFGFFFNFDILFSTSPNPKPGSNECSRCDSHVLMRPKKYKLNAKPVLKYVCAYPIDSKGQQRESPHEEKSRPLQPGVQ